MNEFEMAVEMPERIHLSKEDLSDIENWENGKMYIITKKFRARQIKKTTEESGEVYVVLEIVGDKEYSGEQE